MARLNLDSILALLDGVKSLSVCFEQVGAVLINPLTGEYVTGYNHNGLHRLCECEDTEGETLPMVVHAEADAFAQAKKLFTPEEISRMYLFTCRRACVKCTKEIELNNVRGVFYALEQPEMEHIDRLRSKGVTVLDYTKDREKVEKILQAGTYVLH